ncbi:protein of unknown function (plasmid) [Cupriavidus neocaledonicus]|uniref:Uncharacterized protein n=1 Tax=Cupriavidus neocaledonicus TaxID=1040979 RepID=A0A375HR95_9BURK|nr:hypothetical protein CBM2605_B50115 [Cupriavidus neocaledonicus]SPD60721.1 protein of unknown function [Cupriavidus neocaledonicus]
MSSQGPGLDHVSDATGTHTMVLVAGARRDGVRRPRPFAAQRRPPGTTCGHRRNRRVIRTSDLRGRGHRLALYPAALR